MNEKLIARERRARDIQSFLRKNPDSSLLVIKANIPSFLKDDPIDYYLVNRFFLLINEQFQGHLVGEFNSDDGYYILYELYNKNIHMKMDFYSLEEIHPLGRLIDLDFYIEGARSVSRRDIGLSPRKCFICEKDAFICIRKKTHTKEEIENYIRKTFMDFMKYEIEDLIDYSILKELRIEEKFGLVSPTENYNHPDMDYDLMVRAKNVILPYFKEIFEVGYNELDLKKALKKAREIGVIMEEKMFKTTSGINAYKGVIFLIGGIMLALGNTLRTSMSFDDIFNRLKEIFKDIEDDFNIFSDTFTTELYKTHKITGIRGVVKDGLKIVKDHLKYVSIYSTDQELRNLLFVYIIKSDDTVFIKRSTSYEKYLKHKAHLKTLNPNTVDGLQKINQYAVDHNLSFGGSADLLIASLLLNYIKFFIF